MCIRDSIHFVTGLFGEPTGVHYFPNIEQGVDTSGILILEYPSFKCACIAAKDCAAPLSVNIQGDKGCIFSHSNTSRFPEFSYQENGKEAVPYELVKDVPVFYDELRAFADYWIKAVSYTHLDHAADAGSGSRADEAFGCV